MGSDEMVMVDMLKRRMVTMGTDSPSLWTIDPVATRVSDLGWPYSLLYCDVNSDNHDDLILIDGDRYRIWLFKTRTQTGEVAADIEGTLPASTPPAFWKVTAGDLEGDGKPDFLIHNGNGTRPSVLFDFATSTPEVRQVAEVSSVKNARIHPWDPSGKPMLVFSGVNVHPQADGDTRIYQVAQDRSLSLVEEISGEGEPADLDGQFPPEFVDFSGKLTTGKGIIRAKSGGIWSTALELVIEGYASSGFVYPETASAVADFDGDGREEIILVSAGSSEIFGLQTAGAPGSATVSPLPSLNSPVWSLSSVRSTNSVKAHLTVFSFPFLLDALGNPTMPAGYGSRTWLWRDAFNSANSKTYLLGPRRLPDRLAVADFNGDLQPDVGALHAAEGQFSVFKGPDWNTPQYNRPKMNGGFTGNSLVVCDFTGDQVPDVLLPKSRKIGSIKTLRQPGSTPDISFSTIVDYQFSTIGPAAPQVPDRVFGAADFDQDNDIDTLIFDPYQETLVWAENEVGTGAVIRQHPIALAGRWWVSENYGTTGHYEWITQDQVLILDADVDGDPDIITVPSALGNRVTLHRNQGGSFSLQTLTDLTSWPALGHTPIGPPIHLLAGRFINIPAPIQFAIFGRTVDAQGNPRASITVAHGGIGAMQYGQAGAMPDFGAAAVCDFNGDGLDDLLTAGTIGTDALGNPTGDTSIRFHRSKGDGTFAESVVVTVPLGLVSQLLAADFTGDGRPDIVATSKETGMVELYSHAEFPAYPGYAEWIAIFPGIDPATTADPDGDGISNLLEFARGTPPDSRGLSDPRIPTPPVAAEIRVPTDFQNYVPGSATHPRPRLANGDSCEVILETSTDMTSWFTSSSWNSSTSFDPAYPQWDTLSWTLPVYDEKSFYRFKVVYRTAE